MASRPCLFNTRKLQFFFKIKIDLIFDFLTYSGICSSRAKTASPDFNLYLKQKIDF
jgi:hypothetical protein